MTSPLTLVLACAAFLLILYAFRSGAGSVANEVASQPPVFPTVTPFVSPLCGKDNRGCTLNLDDWQRPPSNKGLILTNPPR
jgi:hypothetical protein